MNTFLEAKVGSLLSAGGICWMVYAITNDFTTVSNVRLPTGGPTEMCALGIVIWLHAKYLKSVRAH